MYKITIKGKAETEYPIPEELDGIDCQDEFSEYFDDFTFVDNVTDGYMHFEFKDGFLWTITTYTSTRLLTEKELEELGDYTQGQWSDGIGEGFEQFPCYEASKPFKEYDPNYDDYEDQEDADNDLEVFISPWYYGQELIITQEEIK